MVSTLLFSLPKVAHQTLITTSSLFKSVHMCVQHNIVWSYVFYNAYHFCKFGLLQIKAKNLKLKFQILGRIDIRIHV